MGAGVSTSPHCAELAPVSKGPSRVLVLDRSGVAALPRAEASGWSAALPGATIASVDLAVPSAIAASSGAFLRFPISSAPKSFRLRSAPDVSWILALPFPSEPVSRAHPEGVIASRVAPAKNGGAGLWITRIARIVSRLNTYRIKYCAFGHDDAIRFESPGACDDRR